MDFTESITVQVPDVEDQVALFSESDYRSAHGLIIETAAIHAGLTANFNLYPEESLEAALASWVSPYPKPIILNHDTTTEPLGRVMAAKMAKEDDGTPYTMLQIAITDPEAIAKVSDKRYLTGSVGGAAKRAICSICSADWAEASMSNLPCSHRRGKTYKGQLAYLIMSEIEFNEYSFVNVPADKRSHVRNADSSTNLETKDDEVDQSGWVRTAKIFALSMDSEEILEFSESQDGTNVLSDMKRKDAVPAYMQVKGAFISALAMQAMENANEDKELEVPEVTEEDDVLGVVGQLNADLTEEEEAPEPVAEETEEVTASEGDVEEEEASVDTEDETPVAQEEAPETKEDENKDVLADADETQEEKGEEVVTATADATDEPVAEESEKVEEEVDQDEPVTETDLDEANSALESRVEVLEQTVNTLTAENTELKAALKRQLAERVVDAKIARGLGETESRKGMIEEHANRSASSLADSLRDLASMPATSTPKASVKDAPKVEEQSVAVSQPGAPVYTEDVADTTTPTDDDSEGVLVDILMGRRKI